MVNFPVKSYEVETNVPGGVGPVLEAMPMLQLPGHLDADPRKRILRDSTTRSVVVLGGTGFIGTSVSRHLLLDGHRVSVVGRRRPERMPLGLGRANFVEQKVSDVNAYERILDGVTDVVYSFTGLLPYQSNVSPLTDIAESLSPLISLLEALRTRPDVSLVFLSSGGTVYGNPRVLPVPEDHPTDPLTSYGIMKLTAEKYIGMYRDLYGVRARVLRVANAYGPLQPVGRNQGVIAEFMNSVIHGRPLSIFGTGRSVRDYIHVEDVAAAVVATLGVGGPNVLNVGTGVGTSLLQLHQILQEVSGERIELNFFESRGFDIESIVLDSSSYQALTGLSPIDFKIGVEQTWNALTA
ncbi:NAD-dependent epimerase/dehydratase family protein [Cryobacterium sp. Hh11]|uniref:NAD-dependent epimerase/dehydratase family protein n=1 Tax=Cryobacterium sp. Hh11 TaxID=2555868 RepID=UPI001069DB49|nr:NAD-dependent epimerase/dehydratase family protein [Cryobacterium sp. Hh11]TFD54765.1 NAD-dependent epimerase/dehydratase family protein [Cryobacterium sp. Hh11]